MSEATGSNLKDLYTEESLSDVRRKLNRRWLVLGLAAAVLLTAAVGSMILRFVWSDPRETYPLTAAQLQTVTSVSVVLLGFFSVFWIDLFCMPLLHYRKLVANALTGRSHVQAMEFARLDSDPCLVDGVSCRSLIFLGEPDKHGSREQLFYLDEALPLPELLPGRIYHVKFSGRTIIGLGS